MTVPKEADVVYEATLASIARARNALLAISTLCCIGTYYLFWWYGSWDRARVAAREGVIAAVTAAHASNQLVTGDLASDTALLETTQQQLTQLLDSWSSEAIDVPLLGLKVSKADFPTAIVLVSAALLLWLLFFQRRLNACLSELSNQAGWRLVRRLLELHFVLIGRHSTAVMRGAAYALILSLPVLAFAFLASDCIDLYLIRQHPIQSLAFHSREYSVRVSVRLVFDVALCVVVAVSGFMCLREYREAENKLLRFADEGDAEEVGAEDSD